MPLFGKKKKKIVDIDKDLQAISEYVAEVGSDLKELYKLLEDMRKLRKREHNMKKDKAFDEAVISNTEEQVRIWDDILRRYEFLDQDIELNGQRVKMIAGALRRLGAQKNIDPELQKMMKSKDSWTFNW